MDREFKYPPNENPTFPQRFCGKLFFKPCKARIAYPPLFCARISLILTLFCKAQNRPIAKTRLRPRRERHFIFNLLPLLGFYSFFSLCEHKFYTSGSKTVILTLIKCEFKIARQRNEHLNDSVGLIFKEKSLFFRSILAHAPRGHPSTAVVGLAKKRKICCGRRTNKVEKT